MKKKLLFALVFFINFTFSFSQTNVFPTTGSVGIGTTTPAAKLHVVGDIYSSSQIADRPNTTVDWNSVWQCGMFDGFDALNAPESGWFWGINLGHRSNYSNYRYGGQLAIRNTNLSPALYFRSRDVNGSGTWAKVLTNVGDQYIDGNLGIGSATPTQKLQVNGGAFINSANGLYLGTDNNVIYAAQLRYNTNGNLEIKPRSGYNTIFTSGKVGIRTANPTEALQVGDVYSATQNNIALWSNTNGFGEHSKVVFKMLVGGTSGIAMPNSTLAEIVTSAFNGEYNRLDFRVGAWNNNNDAGASKLSILSNGNIGIGTTTPARVLDVRVQGALSNTVGEFVALTRLQGTVQNNMMVNDYFVRENGSGPDGWTTASYVRGVSVDASFLTPSTLKSWIKQFPSQDRIDFGSAGQTTMTILAGKVGINCTNPDKELTVKGTIHAKEIVVDTNYPFADYVFEPTYNLKPLAEVEAYVNEKKHLPEMPSAAEVADKGLNMGEMQNKLLQKIEELTLYVIELEKINKVQEEKLTKVDKLEKDLELLKSIIANK